MKLVCVIGPACVVFIVIATLAQCTPGENAQPESAVRIPFKLPKMFDFERFKQIFKKSYSSLTEELARKRLYLGRAFHVFLSAISYKHRRSSSYLAVNKMSDWTPDEVQSTHINAAMFEDHVQRPTEFIRPTSAELNPPVTDLETIEREFDEILSKPKSEPGFKEIADELLKASGENRRKRSTSSTRDLSLDDLVREPKAIKETSGQMESNNPNYEPPELTSFGGQLSEQEELPSLSEQAANWLASVPGVNLVHSAVRFVASSFESADSMEEIYSAYETTDIRSTDYSQAWCMFQPRIQGKCGSCYAFAMIAMYEWHHCQLTGFKMAFSEQYVVDCGPELGIDALMGCNGGIYTNVTTFINKYGLEPRAHYPYRAAKDACPYNSMTPPQSMGYIKTSETKLVHVKIDFASYFLKYYGPMVVNLKVSDAFSFYGGGVDIPVVCKENSVHSVLLVGEGREDGLEYWLFKNSYGVEYGEIGFYKMSKLASKRCIFQEAASMLQDYKLPHYRATPPASDPIKRRYGEYLDPEGESIRKRARPGLQLPSNLVVDFN